jgi:hypothetical protein
MATLFLVESGEEEEFVFLIDVKGRGMLGCCVVC